MENNTNVETEEQETTPTTIIQGDFSNIYEQINVIKAYLKNLDKHVHFLEKSVVKNNKRMTKVNLSHRNKPKRKPSGFAKPSPISTDLCFFLDKEDGSEIARTEVTKQLITYIKTNSLQAKENNKCVINPDDRLRKLLSINTDDKLTYFNLQKYMNKHFLKSPTKVTVNTSSSSFTTE
jgi:chromatin remodeling complex protein RSC6